MAVRKPLESMRKMSNGIGKDVVSRKNGTLVYSYASSTHTAPSESRKLDLLLPRRGTACLRDPARGPSRRAAGHFNRARNRLAAVQGLFQVLEIVSHSCRAFSQGGKPSRRAAGQNLS